LAAAYLLALTVSGRLRILHGEERSVRKRLTPREREVLTWAAAGKSAWETSVLLGISEATVITHLEHIRRKLNVANTTHAVVVALQIGELQPC
jgi:LuxR family quorum sensing-dependent transcriptional regulator